MCEVKSSWILFLRNEITFFVEVQQRTSNHDCYMQSSLKKKVGKIMKVKITLLVIDWMHIFI